MHPEDDKMRWQFGGNFEPVRMVCELDWKECPSALANYIWSEIVTDVIECLTNDGLIWRVLAMLFVCTLLVRTFYWRVKCCQDVMINRKHFNRVGYKVQDLELKVNILTYKMQYGTWPLPHQIHGSAIRKQLRNLKLTLSSPDDYNTWIKHLLFSPLRKNPYLSYSKLDSHSARHLNGFFNTEEMGESKEMPPEISAIDCSLSKSSKTSTEKNCMARSNDKCSHRNSKSSETIAPRARRVSISENSVLRKRIDKSVSRRENEDPPVRSQSQKRNRRAARERNPPFEGSGRTMDECKRYLKQLKTSNKNFGQASSASEISDGSSIRADWNSPQVLLRSSKEITDMVNETEKRYSKNTSRVERFGKKRKDKPSKETTGEIRENDLDRSREVSSKKLLPPTLNITFHAKMFPRDPSIEELASILVSGSPRLDRSRKTSRETLQQVKKRLESLQNVLEAYENRDSKVKAVERVDRNEEKLRTICQSVATTLNSIKQEIDRMHEGKNSRVTFNFDEEANELEELEKLEQAGSAVSPESSKVFKISQQTVNTNLQQDEPSLLEDLSILPSRNYDTGTKYLQMCFNDEQEEPESEFFENYDKECQTYYEDYTSKISRGVGLDKTNADLLELAIQSEKVKRMSSKSPRNVKTSENSENYPVPMETDEDTIMLSRISSQSEISRDSESVDKSTGLLLQQALQFKKALLSQMQKEKCQSTVENEGQIFSEVEMDERSQGAIIDYGPEKLLEIINEENASTERSIRTCDGSDVGQWNERFSVVEQEQQNSQNFDNGDLGLVPSEYFSLSSLPENVPKVKNINELVVQSARKIKGFTEMFSQNQNRAILEARTAIKNQKNSQNVHSEKNPEDPDTDKVKESWEEIEEGSSENPNLTLKRQRGLFSIADKVSSKTVELMKINEIKEDSILENETEKIKSKEEDLNDDISVIHESLTITESDHNRSNEEFFNCASKPLLTENKFNADAVLLSASSSIVKEVDNEMVHSPGENQNQIKQKQEIGKQENNEMNKDREIVGTREIELHENRNLLYNEELAENDKLNHEKLLMNFLSTFSSHCSSLCITDQNSNIFNQDSTNYLRNAYVRGEEQIVENQRRQHDNDHASKSTIILSKKSQQIVETSVRIHGKESVKLSQEFMSTAFEKCKKKHPNLHDIPMESKRKEQTSEWSINDKREQLKDVSYSNVVNLTGNTSRMSAAKQTDPWISKSNLPCNNIIMSRGQEVNAYQLETRSNLNLPNAMNVNFVVGRRRNLSAESHCWSKNEGLGRKRSRSYVTPRKSESSPRYSTLKTDYTSPWRSKNDAERTSRERTSSKSQIPTLKATSRSSIPILKTRLESARKTERENCLKSPLKSPSTTVRNYSSSQYKETEYSRKVNDQNIEKKRERLTNTFENEKPAEIPEDRTDLTPRDRMVIYINVLAKHDTNVTRIVDPKKFMAYARNREIHLKGLSSNDRTNDALTMAQNEKSETSGLNNCHAPNDLSVMVVKASWTETVEQKETDVTAKPSVTDISTSISDLQPDTEFLKNAEKFQVFGVPKELTNEEYVVLLETLNQDSNAVHLHEIAKLCNRIESSSLKTE